MVSDHGARAEPICPGRELRAETKFELPKLRGGPYSAADCHTVGRSSLFTLQNHCKAPHAAWVAQTLLRPSAPDPGGWAGHAPRGRSPSRRASEAATRSAACLPSVWQSAALQGPPRSLGSSNFASALRSRPLRMGWARAPWSLAIQSGLGGCYEVSYVPACRTIYFARS